MRKPSTPRSPDVIAHELGASRTAEVLATVGALPEDGRHLHWDELRHRSPPGGLSLEEWWLALRRARLGRSMSLSTMARAYGVPFSFVATPRVQELLHLLDRNNVAGALIRAAGNEDAVTEYRIRQLIEEAISSSEIEGARPATRELARAMIREGRAPSSKDERMILNNHRAMARLLELRAEDARLDRGILLELHRILGEDTLDVEDGAGRFRNDRDEVAIADLEGNVWHIPPPARAARGLPGLEERVDALLALADGGPLPGGTFLHPIVRAILCHFWLGYEHPFVDGNGRMARALFYWVMLREGYEMAEFLSISGPIDRRPNDYYRAFAYVETDGGDLTYFVLHQLAVIDEALLELRRHLEERARRNARLSRVVKSFDDLNYRQRALLQHAIEHPSESYTIEGHARSHGVHYQTARTDLLDLVRRGLLAERRVGTAKRFQPAARFTRKLAPR